MPLTRGGRAITAKPAPRPTPPAEPPAPDPYRFGVEETRLERRVAYVIDGAMRCHAAKVALAKALPERDWLLGVLQERSVLSLEDDPYRPDGERRLVRLDAEVIDNTLEIVTAETWADAWWRRMTPDERHEHQCDKAWETTADRPELLGWAWRIWKNEAPLPPDFTISPSLIVWLNWDVAIVYQQAGLIGREVTLNREELARRRHELQSAWGTPGRR